MVIRMVLIFDGNSEIGAHACRKNRQREYIFSLKIGVFTEKIRFVTALDLIKNQITEISPYVRTYF